MLKKLTLFSPYSLSLAAIKFVSAVFLLTGLLLGAVGLALAPYAYFLVTDRILPGVHFYGIPLGGLSAEQAASVLEGRVNQSLSMTLSDGQRAWMTDASDFGLRLDTSSMIDQAHAYGRTQRFLQGFLDMAVALQEGWQPELAAAFDEQAARESLQYLASQVLVSPIDASLRIENSRLVERPAVQGFVLDIEKTVTAWRADPNLLWKHAQAPLYLSAVPAQVQDVSQARAEAERLLSIPVRFEAFDPITGEMQIHSVPAEEVAAWLHVSTAPAPEVTLDETRMNNYLDRWSVTFAPERWLERQTKSVYEAVQNGQPVQLLVRHAPSTIYAKAGDTLISISWRVGMPYWMLLQANPGLNPDSLFPGQVLNVPSKDELLPLPIVRNKRIVISISQQHMWTYQDGSLLWEYIISTGIDRSPTQPGIFQVQSHYLNAYASVWDLYMPNFIGIYEAWPGFMNGIHGLPTLSNGQRLWANILGRPASYGCIILGLQEAEQLYYWAEPGVVVEIQP
jgi:L,D-transpeptidase ErfK/SrfK